MSKRPSAPAPATAPAATSPSSAAPSTRGAAAAACFSPDATERALVALKAEAAQLERDARAGRDTSNSRMRAGEIQEEINTKSQTPRRT